MISQPGHEPIPPAVLIVRCTRQQSYSSPGGRTQMHGLVCSVAFAVSDRQLSQVVVARPTERGDTC